MTPEELIAKQQLEIERLKKRVEGFEQAKKSINNICICIGGPLNDNKLKFTPEQMHIFSQILATFDVVPEAV